MNAITLDTPYSKVTEIELCLESIKNTDSFILLLNLQILTLVNCNVN